MRVAIGSVKRMASGRWIGRQRCLRGDRKMTEERTKRFIAREIVDSHEVETKEENDWIVCRTNAST